MDKIEDTIHIHTDIEILHGKFIDRIGNPIIVDTHGLYGYALQGSNIVRMFYSKEDAIKFYEHHRYMNEKLEPIYYYHG